MGQAEREKQRQYEWGRGRQRESQAGSMLSVQSLLGHSLSAPPQLLLTCALSLLKLTFKKLVERGAWVAQSVKRLTSAQVMILRFVSSSPTSGSVLTARSLEPPSDSVSPSLSAPPLLTLCLSLSQINKH